MDRHWLINTQMTESNMVVEYLNGNLQASLYDLKKYHSRKRNNQRNSCIQKSCSKSINYILDTKK